MKTHNEYYEIFSRIMLNSIDNKELIQIIVIDALYKDYKYTNSLEMIFLFLEKNSNDLSANKIHGIISAILEFQIRYSISESIYKILFKLLLDRIDDKEESDKIWIKKIFLLFINGYSFNRLIDLIYLLEHPFINIPEYLINDFTKTFITCFEIEAKRNGKINSFIDEQIHKIKQTIEEKEKSAQYIKIHYDKIIEKLELAKVHEIKQKRVRKKKALK